MVVLDGVSQTLSGQYSEEDRNDGSLYLPYISIKDTIKIQISPTVIEAKHKN